MNKREEGKRRVSLVVAPFRHYGQSVSREHSCYSMWRMGKRSTLLGNTHNPCGSSTNNNLPRVYAVRPVDLDSTSGPTTPMPILDGRFVGVDFDSTSGPKCPHYAAALSAWISSPGRAPSAFLMEPYISTSVSLVPDLIFLEVGLIELARD